MTNSRLIGEAVARRCSNTFLPPERHHRHALLMNGRASAAERYPERLVTAILKALRQELRLGGFLSSLDAGVHVDEPELLDGPSFVELRRDFLAAVFDEVTGEELPQDLVDQARDEEYQFMVKLGVFEYDTVSNCVAETGANPVPTRHVDVDKGDKNNRQIRSRFVVCETKKRSLLQDPAEIFSATPPYEAFRLLLSVGMTGASSAHNLYMFIDISRAHPHCPMLRRIWVDLPCSDPRYGEPDLCWRLVKTLYGCRDAGRNFELFTASTMGSLGFVQGTFSVCLYFHAERNLAAYIHGDSFVLTGIRTQLEWFRASLSEYMLVKVEGVLGPDRSLGDTQELLCLNRIVRWVTEHGIDTIEIEADPRHVEILTKSFGLHGPNVRSLSTPGVKPKEIDSSEALAGEPVTNYRSGVMRAAFLSEDRPDLKFATKELAKDMSVPTVQSTERLKHLARYLVGRPRLIQRMRRQRSPEAAVAKSDSDHAGCLKTRRSTSCSVLLHGDHCIKLTSTTQVPIALSSGESEFYALVKTACQLLGLRQLLNDLGRPLGCILYGDASASRGMASRRGAGKIRHIETQALWLQRAVTTKNIIIRAIAGKINSADLGTKHLSISEITAHLEDLGYYFATGRSSIALRVNS